MEYSDFLDPNRELYKDWTPDCRDEKAISFFMKTEKKYNAPCSNMDKIWISKKIIGQEANPLNRDYVGCLILEPLYYKYLIDAVYPFENFIKEIQKCIRETQGTPNCKISIYSSVIYNETKIIFDDPIISMDSFYDVYILEDGYDNDDIKEYIGSKVDEYNHRLKTFLSNVNHSRGKNLWLSMQSRYFYGKYVNTDQINSITTSFVFDKDGEINVGKCIDFKLSWGQYKNRNITFQSIFPNTDVIGYDGKIVNYNEISYYENYNDLINNISQ